MNIPDATRNTVSATSEFAERFAEFDPATLYEATGQRGMVDPAIRPAWTGAKVCGVVITVQCPAGDNLMLHKAVTVAPPGSVIVAGVGGYLLAGAWGEVLTVAAQARGIAGLVIDGAVRDIEAIADLRFPVFSRGLAIGACTKKCKGTLDCPINFGGVVVHSGDIVVGDHDGLVMIDRARAELVYNAAAERRRRELEIIRELRNGRTTIELLGLGDVLDNPERENQ